MQNQIHSYAFQLNENCQVNSALSKTSVLACLSKQKTFAVGAKKKGEDSSILSFIHYDEEYPRKSIINHKNMEGSVTGLYPISNENSQQLLVLSKVKNEWALHNYGNNFSEQEEPPSKAYSQQDSINDLVLKKGHLEGYLCGDHLISMLDIGTMVIKEKLVTKDEKITHCLIDPLHEFLTYATDSQNITICDKNHKKDKFTIRASIHGQSRLTGLDFNPNKQYYLMTSHQECLKFWDIRKGSVPVKCFEDHHSLITDAKYNHSHDELVACSYDDGSVGLFRIASVSSAPTNSQNEDVLVKLYDQHEDSVFKICWSSFSPWTFASLSYNASTLVANLVPSVQKYRILL